MLQKSKNHLLLRKDSYQEMLDAFPETIFEVDLAGNFLYLNKPGFDTLGYSEKDLANGLNILQFFIPKDRME